MLKRFYPNIIVKRFHDVTIDLLNKHKIEAIILDIDNTLVAYEMKEPTDEVLNWLSELQSKGIKACIVSNAKKERVDLFNKKLGIYAIYRASKPSVKGFLEASKMMQSIPSKTAVIGDQIFTDIYGGRKSNMFSILVTPISTKEIWPIKAKRLLEYFVLRSYKKNKLE